MRTAIVAVSMLYYDQIYSLSLDVDALDMNDDDL